MLAVGERGGDERNGRCPSLPAMSIRPPPSMSGRGVATATTSLFPAHAGKIDPAVARALARRRSV